MTENEAKEILQEKYLENEYYFAERDDYPKGYDAEFQEAIAVAVKVLSEYQKYRSIGTVEECHAAVEKQRAKKPIEVKQSLIRYTDGYICPSCGGGFTGTGIAKCCYHCGQNLDWGDTP